MDDTVTINEINFDHHPAPWRMEDVPKGWGGSTVVFDANNECVYHKLYPIKSTRETWENIVRLVNQKQSPEGMGSDNPDANRLLAKCHVFISMKVDDDLAVRIDEGTVIGKSELLKEIEDLLPIK